MCFNWFKKDKYSQLTREEVTDAIFELEKELKALEDSILSSASEISAMMARGAKEKDRSTKLFIAKKINMMKAEREQNEKRAMYLMYNIQMLGKLRQAIDDNKFFGDKAKGSLNSLLADQQGLAQFLNQALQTKVRAEDILTSADETFKEVEGMYEENATIYGKSDADDELLSMFETQESMLDGEINESGATENSPESKKEV
jgi:predicted  nucleic acid-binding Zn-ribbon protein